MQQKSYDKEASPKYWRRWYVLVLVVHGLVILGLLFFTMSFHS